MRPSSRVARATRSESGADHRASPAKQKYSSPRQDLVSSGTISGLQARKFWIRATRTSGSWM
jgi:hypothetical protein